MNSPTSLYIKNATIFTEDETITNGSLLIKDGKIDTILQENEQLKSYPNRLKMIDGTNLHIIPGFIDGHIHGANGADVMDATESALDTMAAVLPKEGTTSFMATTITQSPENIERALMNIATYQNKQGQAEMIGAHLEGPFIEESRKGAQPLEFIMEPSIEQFKKWQSLSNNKIKTITMAPDLDEDGSFMKYLVDSGVNVSAGHTDANFAGMKKAISQGVRQVTHL